jgi:hypothetical protein
MADFLAAARSSPGEDSRADSFLAWIRFGLYWIATDSPEWRFSLFSVLSPQALLFPADFSSSRAIGPSSGAVQERPPPSIARDCLLRVKELPDLIHRRAGSCTPSLLLALPLVIWPFSLGLQKGSILMRSLVCICVDLCRSTSRYRS